ncbi:MAG: AMP-binding protein [Armatimonadetes bacterium]|nr:AMP-binding protein [Armatimonadota bacterium]
MMLELDRSRWTNHYDTGVPASVEIPRIPLTRFLHDAAAAHPTRAALWSARGSLSYQQLVGEVQRFSAVLAQQGVRAGDRVLVMLPNSLQQVVAFYGTLWRGAVAVLSSPDYPPGVLESHLVDSAPRLAVIPHPANETMVAAIRGGGPEHILFSSGREYTRTLRTFLRAAVGVVRPHRVRRRFLRWRALMRAAHDGFPLEPVDPDSPAVVIYTGGTTGAPMGVVLSHRALVANAVQLRAWDPRMRDGEERFLGALPLCHAYGLSCCLNLSVLLAGTVILTGRWDPDRVLELCTRFRPTLFPGIPSLYGALLARPNLRSYRLSSIRACISGAAPLPVEVQEGFEKVTRGRLVEGYGLTEAGPVTHANPFYGARQSGSIGVPLPSTEARVICPETGADLPDGKVGELVVRGPQLMDGYWNNPEASSRVLRDGWLHTGDMATQNRDGRFFLINRRREVLLIEGRDIFPRDIEEVLYEHPAVLEAAVAGWPPPAGGEAPFPVEELHAYVVPRPGQELHANEVIEFCRRRLPPYLVPARVRRLDALPRSRFGKLLRRELYSFEGYES